jgi:hypothetical protein
MTNRGNRFFTLSQSLGRWHLLSPEGVPFFSLGLNHIDSSALRHVENESLWRERFGNSQERWLRESVRPRLLDWGFNTVGWVQEVVSWGPTSIRHSRSFVYEEYQWLDLPYCHMLPFADFHWWEYETRLPDFFSSEWAQWCDYVAREHCARMRDDPKLIGYFYVDCPSWAFVHPGAKWRGSVIDPEMLRTDAGRSRVREIATQYYRVTHDAVRRYDPHHLILGDRYEANDPLPMEVVESALPFVDVLSFQDFLFPAKNLDYWHRTTGKPVLWADGSRGCKDAGGVDHQEPTFWAENLSTLLQNPGCIGAHLCGAFLRNRTRKRGLVDEHDVEDGTAIAGIREANRSALERFQ